MFRFIRELNKNPLFIKEQCVRKRRIHKKHVQIPSWIFYALFYMVSGIVSLKIYIDYNDLSIREINIFLMIVISVTSLYYSLKAASNAWGLVCRERENKTYIALLGTMMTARDIFMGNFWIAFYPSAKEFTITFPAFLLMGLILKINVIPLFLFYIFTLIFIAFFSVIGISCSSDSNNSIEARDKFSGLLLFFLLGYTGLSMLVYVAVTFIVPILTPIALIPSIIVSTFNPLINLVEISFLAINLDELSSYQFAMVGLHLLVGIFFYRIIAKHYYKKTVG